MKTSRVAFAVALGWLVMLTILFCIPGTRLPKVSWENKIWLDKWIHLVLFLGLVMLWCWKFRFRKNSFIWITILSLVYGIAMELIQQYFIPFRFFDVKDMVADSLGSIAGYFISVRRFR